MCVTHADGPAWGYRNSQKVVKSELYLFIYFSTIFIQMIDTYKSVKFYQKKQNKTMKPKRDQVQDVGEADEGPPG